MNGFEQSQRNGIVLNLHTVAGNLALADDVRKLRTQLRELQHLEQALIALIEEVEYVLPR